MQISKTTEVKRCCGTCKHSKRPKFRTEQGSIPLACAKDAKIILVAPNWGKKCHMWEQKDETGGENGASTAI